MEWLDRYRDGQRDQVWHELRQLGAAVREPHHLEQARLVCDEMALRARRNVETAVQILTERGYRFTTNDDDQTPVVPHYPPGPRASAHARWLDERFGLPLAVESWVRIVGDVWFVGTHPAWASAAASDPLVIELEGSRYPESDIGEYFADEHQAWSEWPEARSGRAGPFVLPAAPDRLHKDNTSGVRRTASSSPTEPPKGSSRVRCRCPSWATSTGSSGTAGSLTQPTLPGRRGRSGRRSPGRCSRCDATDVTCRPSS